jgi:integrase
MIYKRKGSKYWYAAFYIKGRDGNLIKRAFSTKMEDKDKALEVEQSLKANVQELKEKKRYEKFILTTLEKLAAQTIERPGMPLSTVWEKFSTDSTQSKRTESTMRTKRVWWNKFLEWIEENYSDVRTINEVSRDIAHEYMRTYNDKSSSTFNNCKNSLSSVWQTLMIPAGLKENIWRLISGAENDSTSYRDFSIDEVKTILSNTDGFWKYVVFLQKSQIHGDYIVLIPAKTQRKKKDVYIYLHPDLKKILEFAISETAEDEKYVFPDAVKDYPRFAFKTAYSAILNKCKIKADSRGNVGFHSLRHTFVTINEAAGVDRKVIQGVVGHGSPIMTGHYSHDRESVKILQQMPSLLE